MKGTLGEEADDAHETRDHARRDLSDTLVDSLLKLVDLDANVVAKVREASLDARESFLGLLPSLRTNSFMHVLPRFVARRLVPCELIRHVYLSDGARDGAGDLLLFPRSTEFVRSFRHVDNDAAAGPTAPSAAQ